MEGGMGCKKGRTRVKEQEKRKGKRREEEKKRKVKRTIIYERSFFARVTLFILSFFLCFLPSYRVQHTPFFITDFVFFFSPSRTPLCISDLVASEPKKPSCAREH